MIPALVIALPLLFSVIVLTAPLHKLKGREWETAVIVSFITLLLAFKAMLMGLESEYEIKLFPWYPTFNDENYFSLYLDKISGIMAFVVAIITFLDLVYSKEYMAHARGPHRYYALMLFFLASMEGVVFSINLVNILLFWELVGVASFLLISYYWYHEKIGPRAVLAGRKAILVTRLADLFMLAGVGIILVTAGTGNILKLEESYSLMYKEWGIWPLMAVAIVGIIIGALGKSAQFPFNPWLSDAMEGPTTVSALLHSATMVAAGAYLVARMFPLLEMPFPGHVAVMDFLAIIGAFTAFLAGLFAIAARDLKKLIAFSTMSQLGYMFAALGLGSLIAGVAHLYTHAFFKALLFLCAGAIIHALEEIFHDPYKARDMYNMGGLRKEMPKVFVITMIALLSLMGIPPFAGWWSKELILAAAEHSHLPSAHTVYYLLLIGSMLTAAYSGKLTALVFFGKKRFKGKVHDPGPYMTFSLVTLAILTVVLAPFLVGEMPESLGPIGLVILAFLISFVYFISKPFEFGKLGYIFYKELYMHEIYHGGAKAIIKFASLLRNYVEEAYTQTLVSAALSIGRFYAWTVAQLARLADEDKFDEKIVDGIGRKLMSLSRYINSLQTGDLNFYIALALTGVAVLALTVAIIILMG